MRDFEAECGHSMSFLDLRQIIIGPALCLNDLRVYVTDAVSM